MLRSRAFFSQPPVGGPQALHRLWQTAGVTERPTRLGRAGWGSSLRQASGRCFQDTCLQPFRAPGTVCEGVTSSLGLWRPGRACTLLAGQLLARRAAPSLSLCVWSSKITGRWGTDFTLLHCRPSFLLNFSAPCPALPEGFNPIPLLLPNYRMASVLLEMG